jgi:hypothetical protein
MPRRVRISRGVPALGAECEQCDWFRDERGTSKADNARAAAKRHVESTGHTVYIQRSIGTYIRPSGGE